MLLVFELGLAIHGVNLYRLVMIRLEVFIFFIVVRLIFGYAFVVGMLDLLVWRMRWWWLSVREGVKEIVRETVVGLEWGLRVGTMLKDFVGFGQVKILFSL